MKKKMKRLLCLLLVFTLAFTLPTMNSASAATKKTTKKVKLSKKKVTLYVGDTTKLKVKNTKKKVTWSSSKKKVATVSKKGKVKAKKKGKTTITAKVGKKKLKCKVTVKKKPVPPVTLASVSVVNSYTVQVSLSAAQAIAAGNFTVKTKSYDKGAFNRTLGIGSITSSDNRTYKISLKSDSGLSEETYVQVTVKGLKGTGTASKTIYYTSGTYQYTGTLIYTATQNAEVHKYMYTSGFGYSTVSVSGLPAGMSAKMSDSGEEVEFSGKPTKAGTFRGKLITKDELGNTYTYDMIWLVGSANTIAAACDPVYGVLDTTGKYSIYSSYVQVAGGSGSYSYAIVGNNYGLSVNQSGRIEGSLAAAGNYNVTVQVTDKNNTSLKTNFVYAVSLVQGITITGAVRDMKGNTLPGYDCVVSFRNRDKANRYLTYDYDWTNSDGQYAIKLVPGTYDVTPEYNETVGEMTTIKFTAPRTLDFRLPLYPIAVYSNNPNVNPSSFKTWYNDAGDRVGSGNKLYLQPGTYRLHTSYSMGMQNVTAQLNITVTSNTTSVTASVTVSTMVVGTIAAEQSVAVSLNGTAKAYTFVPGQSGTYYFWSEGNGLDVKGYLYSATGAQLKDNDDGGPGNNFYITEKLTAGTTYYIAVAPYTNGNGGNVTLHVSATRPDDEDW